MRMNHITTYNMDEFYKHDDKQKPQHILSKRRYILYDSSKANPGFKKSEVKLIICD